MSWSLVSRTSPLARIQVEEALDTLAAACGGTRPDVQVHFLESLGDKDKKRSLLDGSAPADFFTRELDDALRRKEADFAVHSAKDLADPLPSDMELIAILPGADPTDSLVCRSGVGPTLEQLPRGAKIGTSSPLRKQELLGLRPDLEVAGIRGTIEERLAQTDQGDYDAVIVATCALKRLSLAHRIDQVLPFATHPLQGHLAVTALKGRADLRQLWAAVDVRLHGPRVWYTGTQIDNFRRPCQLLHRPLIELHPEPTEVLQKAFENLGSYRYLVFTSRMAIQVFVEFLDRSAEPPGRLPSLVAVGQGTANELLASGYEVAYVPAVENAEGLAAAFRSRNLDWAEGDKILLPRSDLAPTFLVDELRSLGLDPRPAVVYRNRALAPHSRPWTLDDVDEVVLTSPSAARSFFAWFHEVPDRVILVPMGTPTTLALRALYPDRPLGDPVLNRS